MDFFVKSSVLYIVGFADVPEGCVIIREHVPISNLFTCLWFNEVDRFTSRDQISFSTVRDKIREKVNWGINMFLDCERRNFVVQVIIFMHLWVYQGMPNVYRKLKFILYLINYFGVKISLYLEPLLNMVAIITSDRKLLEYLSYHHYLIIFLQQLNDFQ